MRRARFCCNGVPLREEGWVGGDEEFVDVALGQDPLGQRVFEFGPLDDAADVERQIAQAMAEAKQRLHRRDLSRTRCRRQVVEGVHPGLDIAHRHRAQRLADEGEEVTGVGRVGALGVRAAAMQPQVQQLLIAGDLGDGRRERRIRTERPIRRTNDVEQTSRNRLKKSVREETLSYTP